MANGLLQCLYLKKFLDLLEELKWLDAFYDCQKVQKNKGLVMYVKFVIRRYTKGIPFLLKGIHPIAKTLS